MLEFRVCGTTPPTRSAIAERSAPSARRETLPVLPKTSYGRLARPAYQEGQDQSLRKALSFNVWDARQFVLWRRDTHLLASIARYDGTNYRGLMTWLTSVDERLEERSRKRMVSGQFYYVSLRSAGFLDKPSVTLRDAERPLDLWSLARARNPTERGVCGRISLSAERDLAEKSEQLAEKSEQLAEKSEQLAEKSEQLRILVKMLVQSGQTAESIAENLHLDIEAVRALL